MKISINNTDREYQFTVEVDPKDPPAVVRPSNQDGPQFSLNWDQAFDDVRHLRRCPACGCRELYVRKDFPQLLGLILVMFAAVVSMWLIYHAMVLIAMSILAGMVALDALFYFVTGKVLVCYRCRSEFRKTPISKHHGNWDLATGEKYRQVAKAEAEKG